MIVRRSYRWDIASSCSHTHIQPPVMRRLVFYQHMLRRKLQAHAAAFHSAVPCSSQHAAGILPDTPPAPTNLVSAPFPSLSSSAFTPFRWDSTAPCASSPTLPAPFYHAPAVLDWERRSVFSSNWLHVGHTGQLPQPGSFFTGSFLNLPYIVLRTPTDRITAYYNVCCHHAMPLATAQAGQLPQGGREEAELVCGYHGWRYGAEDGRLRRATRLKGIEGFKASSIALAGIAVEVVGPFIFAHLSPASSTITSAVACPTPPPPSRTHLQQLHTILSPTSYTSLVHCARRSYRLRCNWKVYTDNYLDGGYHVSHAHPALASALDLNKYSTDVLSSHLSLQSSPPSNTSSAARVSSAASYLHLYPQLMVNRYGRWMDTNVVVPLTATECEVEINWWCDSEMSESERQAGLHDSEMVQMEDVGLCEGVQRGLESSIYASGRYAPTVEHAMHAMHRTYYSDITSLAVETGSSKADG